MCDLGNIEMAMRRAYHFIVVKSCDSTYRYSVVYIQGRT